MFIFFRKNLFSSNESEMHIWVLGKLCKLLYKLTHIWFYSAKIFQNSKAFDRLRSIDIFDSNKILSEISGQDLLT